MSEINTVTVNPSALILFFRSASHDCWILKPAIQFIRNRGETNLRFLIFTMAIV